MALLNVDRLKAQLQTSGLSQTNQPLFQVISQLIDAIRKTSSEVTTVANSGGGGGSVGINQLTGDVTAGPGGGTQVATIPPNTITNTKIANGAVTYAKMQNVTAARLLGRGLSGAGIPEEILLGQNLTIDNDETLQVFTETSGGGTSYGLVHDLLSPTHPDTVPDSPKYGDLIWARALNELELPPSIQPISSFVTEDFTGVRLGYEYGIPGQELAGGSGNIPQYRGLLDLEEISVPAYKCPWPIITVYPPGPISYLIDNFRGVRLSYQYGIPGDTEEPVNDEVAQYKAPTITQSPPELQPTVGDLGIWTRLPLGNEGEVLKINNGTPEWAPVGEWVDVPYDAANFTADGGTTPLWTVDESDVLCFRYSLLGKIVLIQVTIGTSSVSGSGPTELRIQMPFAMVGIPITPVCAQENGAVVNDVYVTTDPAVDSTLLFLRTFPIGSGRVFDTTANQTWMSFTFFARIQ